MDEESPTSAPTVFGRKSGEAVQLLATATNHENPLTLPEPLRQRSSSGALEFRTRKSTSNSSNMTMSPLASEQWLSPPASFGMDTPGTPSAAPPTRDRAESKGPPRSPSKSGKVKKARAKKVVQPPVVPSEGIDAESHGFDNAKVAEVAVADSPFSNVPDGVALLRKEFQEMVGQLRSNVEREMTSIRDAVHKLEAAIVHQPDPQEVKAVLLSQESGAARNIQKDYAVEVAVRDDDDRSEAAVSSQEAELILGDETESLVMWSTYTFEQSVWDCMFFVHDIEDKFDVLDIAFLWTLNLVIQAWFCLLCLFLGLVETTNNLEEEMQSLFQWRIGVAHQADHYDPLTNTSLAQRVCLRYPGTIQSAKQVEQEELYGKYFDPSRPGLPQGPGLLLLALTLWLALVLREVSRILGFITMIVSLRRRSMRSHGGSMITRSADGVIEVQGLSTSRTLAMCAIVVAPRLLIAALLAFVGTYYLRATIDLEEIILNVFALGFLVEVDNLLFEFAPRSVREAVMSVRPVTIQMHLWTPAKGPKPWQERVVSRIQRSRVLVTILIISVLWLYHTLVIEVQDSLRIVQSILCDGNTNFVFHQNSQTGVLYVAETPDRNDRQALELDVKSLADVFDGVVQVTDLCSVFEEGKKSAIIEYMGLCAGAKKKIWCEACQRIKADNYFRSKYPTSLSETLAMARMSDVEVLNTMTCQDTFTSEEDRHIQAPFQKLLHQLDPTLKVSVCADISRYCLHADASVRELVRRFCPVTCRCDHGLVDTLHGSTWYLDRRGCVPDCDTNLKLELESFKSKLFFWEEPCIDRHEALSSTDVTQLVDDMQTLLVESGKIELVDDGLGNVIARPSAEVISRFASASFRDFDDDWSTRILHRSNPSRVGGCSFKSDASIDLLAWAQELGSICQWAAVIKYIFNLDMCTITSIDIGIQPLVGLCPLTCAYSGLCSSEFYQLDSQYLRIGMNPSAWFNVVPAWGQHEESIFQMVCDSINYMCIRVEKGYWPVGTWLVVNQTHGGGTKTVYNATRDDPDATYYWTGGNQSDFDWAAWTYRADYFCVEKLPTGSSPPCFTISGRFEFSQNDSRYYSYYGQAPSAGPGVAAGGSLHWAFHDITTGAHMAGLFTQEYHFCTYDWASVLR